MPNVCKKYFLYFIVILMVATPRLGLAAVQISATLEDSSIQVGGETVIVVSVAGDDADDPVVPNVPGLTIMNTGRSSSLKIFNGHMSLTAEYMYTVVPEQEGTFTIPPFVVNADGQAYRSNGLTLAVNAGAASQNNQSPNNFQTSPTPTYDPNAAANPVFWVEATVDKKSVFVGEQVLYHFKFYTRQNITQANPILPTFDDFFVEVLVDEKKGEEVINGQGYATWERVLALIPLKPGDLKIGDAAMDIVYETLARPNSRSAVDPFFGNNFFNFGIRKSQKEHLTGKALALNVKPLPQPVPQNYSGLVGNFGVQSSLSAAQVVAGESVTLDIAISGSGNIKDAMLPEWRLAGVKIYFDKPTVETLKSPQGISGKKSFKAALVPSIAGDVVIPDLTLSYLSPVEGNYVELVVPGKTLNVLPAKDEDTQAVLTNAATGEKESVTYKDIAPLVSEESELNKEAFILPTKLVWFGLVLPPVLFVMMMLVGKMRRSLASISERSRDKKEFKRLKSLVSHAACDAGDVWTTAQDYFAAISGREAKALTSEDMRDILNEGAVAKADVEKFTAAIAKFESVKFGLISPDELATARKEIAKVIAGW